MRRWLQRFTVFLLIAVLIAGGLGWATAEALRMEENQCQVQAQKERAEKMRRALWRLDGMISPPLARENSRPFAHFTALHSPIPAMTEQGVFCRPGSFRVPSPLMDVDLPQWMLLHFQFTAENKEEHRWQSPQVLPMRVRDYLRHQPFHLTLANVTPEREEFLTEFRRKYSGERLLAEMRKLAPLPSLTEPAVDVNEKSKEVQRATNSLESNPAWNRQSPNDYPGNSVTQAQSSDRDQSIRRDMSNTTKYAPRGGKGVDPELNLDSITAPKSASSEVGDVLLTSMTPMWFPSPEQPDYLLYARLTRFGQKEIVQGVVIDWPQLRDELQKLVVDLFPGARLNPLPDSADPDAEGVMSALPLQLDPDVAAEALTTGWSPLRIGLGVAWVAVLIALLAIGLSGWSLIDLSERRIRFVSAVTHELRTPLTTLRLYLDMLTSGLIKDEAQKGEYLRTLNSESERLHRLISNVLDFARLEKQSARPAPKDVPLADLFDQVGATWRDRCEASGKELVIENRLPREASLHTDAVLVQQILGNLIDNACKYSKCATDRRVWLRAVSSGPGELAFEVEDCGPGVNRREWRQIFRPFRRGLEADTTAGGVGLGLALAQRWATMLGGKLAVSRGQCAGGACFRLELPT